MHWFDKVEMFVYTTPEDSYAEHQRLLEIEKAFLDKLELAYQVIDTAAGDLGLSAQRKFDCEAWIPTQGRYRELTSTSNCTDFQTRRLDTRGRFGDGVGPVSTLNGTLCAIDPHDRGDPRDPPAGRRVGAAPEGAAALPGWPRGRCEPVALRAREAWRPRLVALDIDGTLLKWVEGAGTTYEQISPRVHDAIHRAHGAGAHVVLSSGRSPHGMTRIADLLGLPARATASRCGSWPATARSSSATRPLEVVHEDTFDAGPGRARRSSSERPTARVAIEERGVRLPRLHAVPRR